MTTERQPVIRSPPALATMSPVFAGNRDFLVTDTAKCIRITRSDFVQIAGRVRLEMLNIALQDLTAEGVAITAFFHIHHPKTAPILSRITAGLVLIFRIESTEWKIATVAFPSPMAWLVIRKSTP